MHANLPVIANRWEKKYGLGGVAELNAELNSLPEYYLPFPAAQGGRIGFEHGSGPMTFQEYFKGKSKFEINKTREEMIREYEEYLFRQKHGPQDRPNVAQGGLIPAHQAGIYGLAEGGRIGFKTRGFVQPRSDGQRPGYTEDEEDTGEVAISSVEDFQSMQSDNDSSDNNPPPEIDRRSQYKITQSQKPKKDPYATMDNEEQREYDRLQAQRRLQSKNITRTERKNLEVGLGLRKPTQSRGILKTIGVTAAILTCVAPFLGLESRGAIKTIAQ